jgi:hypothetical protein
MAIALHLSRNREIKGLMPLMGIINDGVEKILSCDNTDFT